MTLEKMIELFRKSEGEFLKFGRVENKRSHRSDLHAFMLLDALQPGDLERNEDIVSSAEHDVIYLGVDPEGLAENVTPEQVLELQRCGVRWDSEFDCLAMFV